MNTKQLLFTTLLFINTVHAENPSTIENIGKKIGASAFVLKESLVEYYSTLPQTIIQLKEIASRVQFSKKLNVNPESLWDGEPTKENNAEYLQDPQVTDTTVTILKIVLEKTVAATKSFTDAVCEGFQTQQKEALTTAQEELMDEYLQTPEEPIAHDNAAADNN